MKRLLLTGFCLSLLSACGETESIEDTDALDERDGVIEWERADSNSVVRPGSNEADAVMRYVNQPIADAAAGQRMLNDLDSKLNILAARNIVAARAGVDGQFGTSDDVVFSTLERLDAVPWVGRAALQQLFVLAQDAGFFQTSIACETVLNSRSDTNITTMAQLIEIQNSGCDHFEGNVTLNVQQNLLPAHRSLQAFDRVRSIGGSLALHDRNRVFDAFTFRALEHLGSLGTQNLRVDLATVSFPVLKTATSLHIATQALLIESLEEVERDLSALSYTGTFPNLRKVGNLYIAGEAVSGYEALKESETIRITAASFDGMRNLESVAELRFTPTAGSGPVHFEGFDALTTADAITLEPGRSQLSTDTSAFRSLQNVGTLRFNGGPLQFPELVSAGTIETSTGSAVFTGSFPKLQTADDVHATAQKFPFPALKEVTRDFSLEDAGTFDVDPSVLRHVGGAMTVSTALCQYTQLRSVGSHLYVRHAGGTWNGMNRLETVGGRLTVNANGGSVQGFAALESVVGEITLSATEVLFDGFNGMPEHGGSLNVEVAAGADFSGFATLETIQGSLVVTLAGRDAKFDAMDALLGVSSLTVRDYSEENLTYLPELILVDRNLTITRNGADVRGLPKLDAVNGDLWIDAATSFSGLDVLSAVGGQTLALPSEMPVAERDAFLNQLQQFSGDIRYH